MPTVNLSPLFNDAQLDSSGNPNSGGKLFTYAAGSSTKTNTYTSSAGTTAQANPIVLNSRGEPASPIWLTDGVSYKFVYTNSSDTDPPASPIRTIDNVVGVNDVAATTQSEWIASGSAPTFTAAATFTLVGDQTTEFHVGRRLKCTVTAGTVYVTIAASVFTTLTTVTVTAASLDSGLSAVSYGINSAANTSLPINDSQVIAPHSPLAPSEKLAVATASVSTATITADKVVVTNTNGRKAVLSTVSLTVNIASAGANGLDTGAEGASRWYYFWVIWNGATVAGLISESATAPTMPSGYTHKGLVGAVYNSSGSDFVVMGQRGNSVTIAETAVVSLGSATSVTSMALATAVPPGATFALFYALVTALNTTAVNASIYSNSAGTLKVTLIGSVSTTDAAEYVLGYAAAPLLTAQTLWYAANDANTDVTVNIVGYTW